MARFSDAEVMAATGAQKVHAGEITSFVGVSTDTRALSHGMLFVALKGEKFDAHDFLPDAMKAGASALVVERIPEGVKWSDGVTVFLVPSTMKALADLARFHRDRFHVPIVAITGSNGKTTTKELTHAILSTRGAALKTHGNLNNEIGVPLTLFNLDESHVAAVIEMGMNHKGEIARLTDIARPDAGLITIVQPAHLEGVGSIEGVAEAKGELFHGLTDDATAVVNIDDERIANQAKSLRCRKLTWGRHADAEVRLKSVQMQGRDGLSLTISYQGEDHDVALRLVGDHNAMNATGAFALALSIGYSPLECARGLEAAQAHARRLQIVPAPNKVTVVDDCYNANPASMEAALRTVDDLAVDGRAVAVLGDMLELGSEEAAEHARMGVVASNHVEVIAFFGPRMKLGHAQAVKQLGEKARHFEDIGELTTWLNTQLQPRDYVLVKASRGMKLERVVAALTGTAQGAH